MKQENGAPKVIRDKERESYLNRLVYAAGETTGIKYGKKQRKQLEDATCGRTVFYVTVRQIKRTKIAIKPVKHEVISKQFFCNLSFFR